MEKRINKSENSSLHEFFVDELKDIYWAEKHLTKVLPKMRDAATTEDLKQAIEDHLAETKEQVSRLENVFELLGEKPEAVKCEAIAGITKEGDNIVDETDDDTATRDVGIIMAAQKVEHYEIATYGALVQIAKTLGKDNIAKILAKTLQEEKNADALLTEIAESHVNVEASHE